MDLYRYLFLDNGVLSSADRTEVEYLNAFWIEFTVENPSVVEKAMHILLPFVITYNCEAVYFGHSYIKTKYRNRLNTVPNIRIRLSYKN